MQEAVMASGCVDLFASDMNCSMPIDPLYAEKYKFKLIPVGELVAFEGVEDRLDYVPEKAENQAVRLLEMAIGNFKERKATVEPVIQLPMKETVVGFSSESILDALGGSLETLLDIIKKGSIRGIAGFVSCMALRDFGQDVHSIAVAKELTRRYVLILSMRCGNGALQVGGLCSAEVKEPAGSGLKSVCESLGIPPVLSYGTYTDTGRIGDLLTIVSNALGDAPLPDLPVVAAAPECMEQKATIDAIFAQALGLYTYVNPVPTVTGAPNLVKLLTKDCPNVTGGILHIETNAGSSVQGILSHVESKRKKWVYDWQASFGNPSTYFKADLSI
jgi:carbon-monoxide dehydrogenase catalytic subunit